MVYVVTKIFGVDAIKTSVHSSREFAEQNIQKWIRMLGPENERVRKIERENGEIQYIINESKDPTEYILFILKPCEIK